MSAEAYEFGEEFKKYWPLADFNRNLSDYGLKLLKKCLEISEPQIDLNTDLNIVLQNSEKFPIEFPIQTCRIKSQPVERMDAIQKQIATAYPVLHEKTLYLYIDFLEHKQKYGTPLEKKLYENLTITGLIHRLLNKRCVCFLGSVDHYKLLTGDVGYGGYEYLDVGTEKESAPLVLENVLSYDEIKLSALLAVSSRSELINDGSRRNRGIPATDPNTIESEAIIIGMIGARFAREHVMEYQDIMITPQQNTREMGYGPKDLLNPARRKNWWPFNKDDQIEIKQHYRQLWNRYYEEPKDYIYKQIERDNKRFGASNRHQIPYIFDNLLMKKRYAISFDLMLLEAQKRASDLGKLAYLHVVGFGLGVWRVAAQQEDIYMETFHERLKHLLEKLTHIGVIHFSWFNAESCGPYRDGNSVMCSSGHSIEIFISKRNPNSKLQPPFDNMLLFVSYAWDGNALPGNEFWLGSLDTSNDPSTVCSTLISELHNPHINTKYVCGDNLHVASEKYGLLHVAEYARKVLNKLT